MNQLLDIAIQYRNAGLSAIGGNKVMVNGKREFRFHQWKEFETRKPTEEELYDIFVTSKFSHIAVTTGIASGNLEVIDIDTKNDKEGEDIWADLSNRLLDY
jgi:hypothetical protein